MPRSDAQIHANYDLPEELLGRLQHVAETTGDSMSRLLRDEITRAALWRDTAVERALLDLRDRRPGGTRTRGGARVTQAMSDWVAMLAEHHRVALSTVWSAIATAVVARHADQPTPVAPRKPCEC